jgi:serine/threonine protein kinase
LQLDGAPRGIGPEPLAADDPWQIGSFPIRAVLGSGGMGRVYLGLSPTGPVAVKRVRPDLAKDEKFLIRFGQELDNQGRLPAGVSPRLLATDRTAQPPWFATEYVPGVTLDQAVELTGGRLPVPDCWMLLRKLGTRLRALADAGMVHRDLKPSNIMLTADGVMLIDFGLSLTTLQTRLTSVTGTVGTPPFMAPEQLSVPAASPTPAVDIFALGGVITYAATGEPPFGYDPAVGYRIEHQEPHLDALREADQALAAVVASCLAKDPANRPTAAELSRAQAAAQIPSWPGPVVDHISSLRSLIPLQPDTPGPAAGTSPTAPAGRLVGETGPTSLSVGSVPAAPHRPVSHRLASRRSTPSPKKRRLMLILIPLVIALGASITTLSLSPLMQPQTKPSAPARYLPTPPHPSPSAVHSKRDVAHSLTPAPPAPVVTPTRTPHSPGVVSFTSYDMLENKALHLCLNDSGNFAVESLSCTGENSQGWEAMKEKGNAFALTDRPHDYCLNDSYSIIWSYPCTSSNITTTWWRIGTTTSAGATLVDNVTGKCLTSALTASSNGFSMATCDPSDPRQLWYDAGKT